MEPLDAGAFRILEVARQAGHSPQTCLRDHGHLFDEFDPAVRDQRRP